jgi:beta-galactosidase GanA
MDELNKIGGNVFAWQMDKEREARRNAPCLCASCEKEVSCDEEYCEECQVERAEYLAEGDR